VKPLYRKTWLRFLPIVFNLERANQLSPLPDKDLADFCPLIVENNLVNVEYIDILKIDTEGFEIPVLQGALNTLKAGKIRYIFAETTLRNKDKDHTNFFELKKFLEPYNFNPIGFYDLVPYWGGGNAIDYLNVLFKRWDNQS